MVQSAKKFYLSRSRMLDYLTNLSSSSGKESLTLFIPPHLPPDNLKNTLKNVAAAPEAIKKFYDICTGSVNGVVIFWSDSQKSLIIPPFPIHDNVILDGFETAHLKSMLGRDYIIGLVLIRLGSYGIGVCRGDNLISSKVGTGLVHGRHRQGGSSSRRFECHRDKQIETFFKRVCGHAREQLEPYVKSMDYIVYGGAWETVQLFIKYCPLLQKLDRTALPPLSDTPEPRKAVLEKAVGRIWSSAVYEWEET